MIELKLERDEKKEKNEYLDSIIKEYEEQMLRILESVKIMQHNQQRMGINAIMSNHNHFQLFDILKANQLIDFVSNLFLCIILFQF